MTRFLRWCRRPYLRIYFTPDWQRLAEEGVKAAKAATATAQTTQIAELKRMQDRTPVTGEEA